MFVVETEKTTGLKFIRVHSKPIRSTFSQDWKELRALDVIKLVCFDKYTFALGSDLFWKNIFNHTSIARKHVISFDHTLVHSIYKLANPISDILECHILHINNIYWVKNKATI